MAAELEGSALSSLYDSLSVDVQNRNYRLNVVHIRGVNEMSTEDIANYFKDYKFDSIEWINDLSCNVVWDTPTTAGQAMLACSKTAINQENTLGKANLDVVNPTTVDDISPNENETSSLDLKTLGIPVPPGHWRLGIHHDKSQGILMRFAMKSDKKVPGAEKRSQYYLKHGNPNYGGMVGLISKSKKRRYRETKYPGLETGNPSQIEEDSDVASDSEMKSISKIPKMKMYADEEVIRKKLTTPIISISETKPDDLRNKLMTRSRILRISPDERSQWNDIKMDMDLRSKIEKGKSIEIEENQKQESDLRRKLNQLRGKKSERLINL